MATGTFSTSFGTYYRLQMDWTATQSTANNNSTVTAKLYLVSTSSRSNISSSSSKTFSITIDGTTSSTTGNLNLAGGQKKLLHTYSKVVPHASNGTKSIGITGFMQWGLNINGHTSDVSTSKTIALPKISSASTASTIANVSSWRAGETFSVSVNRSSSAYTHTLRIYVGTTLIGTRTGIGASAVVTFSTPELTTIFNTIGTHESTEASVELDTYSGGTKIGSTDEHGFRIAAALPTDTVQFPYGKTFEAGSEIHFTLVPNSERFYHSVLLKYGGTEITRTEMSPLQTDGYFITRDAVTQINDFIGSRASATFTIEVYTKWVNQVIRQPEEFAITIKPERSSQQPIFEADLIVQDSRYSSRVRVGKSGTFISGVSEVEITVPSSQKAQPRGSAYIVRYTFSVGNKTVAVTPSTGAIVAKIPDVVGNGSETITVTATDSNGVEASVYRIVDFIPYYVPRISAAATRVGQFETETAIVFEASYAPVRVDSVAKNAISTQRYRYRQIYGTWSAWTTVSSSLAIVNATLQLDNTKAWQVEIEVNDYFNTVSTTLSVSAGKPTFFIDAMKSSVGVNTFPVLRNALEIEGRIKSTQLGEIGSVSIGGFASDLHKDGSNNLFVAGDSNKVEFIGGAFAAQKYINDVTFTTNTGKFYFSQKIQAQGGLEVSGTLSADTSGTHTGQVNGNVTSTGTSTFNYTKFRDQPYTSYQETGYCGLQLEATTPFGLGYGVNFKMSKDYLPSSITLSVDSGNLATSRVYTGYITVHGFWFQILRSNSSTNAAWRGTYRA